VTKEPTAVDLLRLALAPILDAVGVLLLVWLGLHVMFGGSWDFMSAALGLGVVGALASRLDPTAARNLPLPMLAYVAVALLSAAAHRWHQIASAAETTWLSLFTPATHLVIMVVFVAGTAYLLRTPRRLAVFTALLAAGVLVIAGQTLFDRISTNFVYVEGGSASLPSVAQWGGMHQLGTLFVIAFPLITAVAFFTQSALRIAAGLGLGAGLLLIAVANGSRSAIATMVVSAVVMGAVSFGAAGATRWRPRYYLLVLAGLAIGLWFGLAQVNATRPLTSMSSGRLPIWTAAVHIIRDHPWLGVGPGNYSVAMIDGGYAERFLPRYASRRRDVPDPAAMLGTDQAHNLLLHVGAETGVAGAAAVIALWVWLLTACWRALVHSRLQLVPFALMMALAAFLMRSTYDNFLDNQVTVDRMRVLVWLLFAAALALQRRVRITS